MVSRKAFFCMLEYNNVNKKEEELKNEKVTK